MSLSIAGCKKEDPAAPTATTASSQATPAEPRPEAPSAYDAAMTSSLKALEALVARVKAAGDDCELAAAAWRSYVGANEEVLDGFDKLTAGDRKPEADAARQKYLASYRTTMGAMGPLVDRCRSNESFVSAINRRGPEAVAAPASRFDEALKASIEATKGLVDVLLPVGEDCVAAAAVVREYLGTHGEAYYRFRRAVKGDQSEEAEAPRARELGELMPLMRKLEGLMLKCQKEEAFKQAMASGPGSSDGAE